MAMAAVLPVRAMVRPRRPHLPLRRSRHAGLDIPATSFVESLQPQPGGHPGQAVQTLILAGRHEVGKPHWSEFDRDGHFAAMEQPELYVGDLRTFVGSLDGR
jgi:hypothetical protein